MIFVLTIINKLNSILRTKIIGHYSSLITRYSFLITQNLLRIQAPYKNNESFER